MTVRLHPMEIPQYKAYSFNRRGFEKAKSLGTLIEEIACGWMFIVLAVKSQRHWCRCSLRGWGSISIYEVFGVIYLVMHMRYSFPVIQNWKNEESWRLPPRFLKAARWDVEGPESLQRNFEKTFLKPVKVKAKCLWRYSYMEDNQKCGTCVKDWFRYSVKPT